MRRSAAACGLLATIASSCSAPRTSAPYSEFKPGFIWLWRREDSVEDLHRLTTSIQCLGSGVTQAEAQMAAATLLEATRRCRVAYKMTRPPNIHNLLVNARLRPRGLCWHWTQDLGCALQRLHLKSLDLHWGNANPNSGREHNCVVLTAAGSPFASGLILDPWRSSGQLLWIPVSADTYEWREYPADFDLDENEPTKPGN